MRGAPSLGACGQEGRRGKVGYISCWGGQEVSGELAVLLWRGASWVFLCVCRSGKVRTEVGYAVTWLHLQ